MYLIIGAGRAALHFSRYFSLKGVPYIQWDRENHSLHELQTQLKTADKVLLLISDSQLHSFYQNNLTGFGGVVIHASGSLEIPGMVSAHPLMTFGPQPYSLDVYEKMGFAICPGTDFHKIFPELQNPFFTVRPEEKLAYHAWAVYSGNFATLLWKEALAGFDKMGVPRVIVETYLKQILHNVVRNPELALTGPLARKDGKIISGHLKQLPEPARSIYQSFVDSYAPDLNMEVSRDANS